ncbi:hypothetical protein A3A67_03435 [Candidatus Peribacteria bacterium RIFCSPLOWO2_01_FULL_51_18]|nr:MAG: hypothetical protein A3C52_04685 [Candidatus Peribacteria bacterium RIFCSPHIGHO2_02_FULL_51_15]OGJ65781.1 MAG: hypothetical protein A3A67_03435 [Candidatus Peribacteria bacterium RIFCSPLOWO2_01_FULL_51_18]
MKTKKSFFSRKTLRTIPIVIASVSLAFFLGIETAGDIEPVIDSTEAGGATLEGDFNGNGVLDTGDAKVALEIARDFRLPTPSELAADMGGDLHVTLEDVTAVLEKLERLQ